MSELFYKNEKVLTLEDKGDSFSGIKSIDNPELLPFSLKSECTIDSFNTWLTKRCIPKNRDGLAEATQAYGSTWLKSKNYASLSDQYWIKRRGEEWKRVNFFTNIYSKEVGDIMFLPWTIRKKKDIKNNSPDLTTTGVTMKRWKQREDKSSYLVKVGNSKTHQEPLSEVLVSVIFEKLGVVNYARYDLCVEGVQMCAKCDNFITKDTELVLAADIYRYLGKKEDETIYNFLLRAGDELEIPGVKEHLDWMIFVDRITANEDRHLGNIGYIRDVNTLKFIGPAPVFDCGSAYWSTKLINKPVKSKVFGDVEQDIFNERKHMCDIEDILRSDDYVDIINRYPCIKQEKKENLCKAVASLGRKLLKEKEKERELMR